MSTATKTDPFPSGWAVAYQSVVGAGEVMRGDRLRADHWIVQKWGESVFCDANLGERFWPDPAGTIETWSERAQREAAEKERKAFEEAAKQNKVTLSVAGVLVCHTQHFATVDGKPATIQKGSKALASDDVTREMPEAWKAEK